MEAWSLGRYRRPQLCADLVEHEGHVVVVAIEQQVYRFACDSVDAAAHMVVELKRLRDSDSSLWKTMRMSDPTTGWADLGAFLDTHSFIRETFEPAGAELVAKARSAVDRATEAATLVRDRQSTEALAAVRANSVRVLQLLNPPLIDSQSNERVSEVCKAPRQENFFVGLLVVELSYLLRCAPVTWRVSCLLLAELGGIDFESRDLSASKIAADMDCFFDEAQIDTYLTLVSHCIEQSAAGEAARFSIPRFTPETVSGLEFLRKAELLARAAPTSWRPNKASLAIRALRNIDSPFIKGCFLEQYHLSARYVEVITPLLHKRLSPQLRQLMFRYYSEELGHEEFERATCEVLRVPSSALARAVPLPLHVAFIDMLIEISERQPTAFFLCLMVTEGMLGEQSSVADLMADLAADHNEFRNASRRHDQLNKDLHHKAIARLAFEHVPLMTPQRQEQAIQWLFFLLELNHRLWSAVVDFYGSQDKLLIHGFLGRAEPVTSEIDWTSPGSPVSSST